VLELAKYTGFARNEQQNFFDLIKHSREGALRRLDGDQAAFEAAHARIAQLVGKWLGWLRMQISEPIAVIRLDFLVRRSAPGEAEVRLLEITENGFDLFENRTLSRRVWDATARSFVSEEGLSL
jgi:hypothetical protein